MNSKITGSILVFAFVLLLIGWMEYLCIRAIVNQNRAVLFPETDGVVTQCSIETKDGPKGPYEELHFLYVYSVDELEFEGQDISFTYMPNKRDVLKRYTLGQKVSVFYDPLRPKRAILSREKDFHYYLFLFGSIPAGVLTVFVLFVLLRNDWTWFQRSRQGQIIGYMILTIEGDTKTLSTIQPPRILLLWTLFQWLAIIFGFHSNSFGILIGSVMTGCVLAAVLAIIRFQRRGLRSGQWIIDSFRKTLTFSDPGLGQRTVPFSRLIDFIIVESRSTYATIMRKLVTSDFSPTKQEILVRFRDEADIPQVAVLTSALTQYNSPIQAIRDWLAYECSPEKR